jgi:hypothetical protein
VAIQFVLLLVATSALLMFIRNSHAVEVLAIKRLAFLAFVALVIVAVLDPGWVTALAHHMGVGRGTDLVLYLLAAAFVFVSMNTYFRFKAQESRFTELARSIAVRDAMTLNAERFTADRR